MDVGLVARGGATVADISGGIGFDGTGADWTGATGAGASGDAGAGVAAAAGTGVGAGLNTGAATAGGTGGAAATIGNGGTAGDTAGGVVGTGARGAAGNGGFDARGTGRGAGDAGGGGTRVAPEVTGPTGIAVSAGMTIAGLATEDASFGAMGGLLPTDGIAGTGGFAPGVTIGGLIILGVFSSVDMSFPTYAALHNSRG